VVYADEQFRQIDRLYADGDVRVSQGTRWITSDHAVMDERQHTAVFTGNPVAHDGEDQIAGTRITVYLDSGKSEVEGPKMVIFPRKSENPDNVSSDSGAP
jgi:lipopolysaccharide export system protein LptA